MKSGSRSGNSTGGLCAVFAAEAAVQAPENGDGAGEEFFPVGQDGITLGHDQRALVRTLVVVVHDPARGDQGPFGRDGVVEDQILLPVEDARQVYAGSGGRLEEKIEDHGNGETGDDLQVFFIAVVQFGKARTDPQRIQNCILPGVVPSHWADGLTDGIHVQRHGGPSLPIGR